MKSLIHLIDALAALDTPKLLLIAAILGLLLALTVQLR